MNNKGQTATLDALQGFLHELRGNEIKSAEIGDPSPSTGAPVKDVDNGTRKPVHGERYSENTADVRKHLGAAGVTGQEDATSVGDKSEKSIGELKRYTADEKAPQSIKDNPMKPKDGSGPGDSTYGDRKFASFAEKCKNMRVKLASEEITETPGASENHSSKSHIKIPAAKRLTPAEQTKQAEFEKAAEEEKRAAAEEYKDVAASGYEIAQQIAIEFGAGLNKSAAEAHEEKRAAAQVKIASIQSAAANDAILFCRVMRGYQFGQQKLAEAGGAPPDAGGAAGLPPEAMAALAGGGGAEGGGGGMPGGEGGGGGGMPGGGMPGGEGGGGGGGGGDAKLEQLAQAMEQLDISPEDLAQAIAHVEQQEGGGGGDAGGGGGAGGMPPGMPPQQ